MRPVFRLVCADCLRSVEETSVNGYAFSPPTTCTHCGGPIEAHWEDPSDKYVTPLSLALTPEETPPWLDMEPGRIERDKALRPPEQVGRFQLRELLGGGGFGQVFRAYDPRLDREVALKVLRESHPTARAMERFFREARAAAQLDHPNIVALHDAGRDDGRCWIAYQFVEGRTLSRLRAEGGALEPRTAARLTLDLADALDHAHRRGVLHRDVKPANVIVDPDGRARLTDFGLARRLDLDATMTVEGTILGTPAYMSPEQASGRSHNADARSDVYSLGVLFYELLSGCRPCDLPSNIPAWRAELRGPLPPIRSTGRRVPKALERICRRALAPEPADRYPDARSLTDDLKSWLNTPSSPTWPIPALTLAAGLVLGIGLDSIQVGEAPSRPPSPPIAEPADRRSSSSTPSHRTPTIRIVIPPRSSSRAVFAIRGNRIYHRESCLALRRTAPEDRATFAGPGEAQAQNLLPCMLCKPGDGDDRPRGVSESR